MKKARNTFLAIAMVLTLSVAFSGVAKAGAFGVPDPTVGATVLGWFDIGEFGTDDVLAVMLNASDLEFKGDADPTKYGVHFIIWTVRSQHVWDKNLGFTKWDIESLSIRDIINSMPISQRAQLEYTVPETSDVRYRGYWTATTVFRSPGNLNPWEANYPHLYANVLTGWVYLVDILAGRTDGYSMVAVEAATLYAGDFATAFTLSFSADFWNRIWWWCSFNLVDPVDIRDNPAIVFQNDFSPWFSNLWDNDNGSFYGGITRADYDDWYVFERFDALAGINASLLTRGIVVSSDDVWLNRLPGTGTKVYSGGGMRLLGRYFKNPASGVTDFANKLVLWCDKNGSVPGVRQVVATVLDEEENAESITLMFPDELTVFLLDFLVGDKPAGVVHFASEDIQYSNGKNSSRAIWRWYYAAVVWNWPPLLHGFYPSIFNVAAGYAALEEQPNELQMLGWTTNEGLGTAQESWSAAFLMNRDYYTGIEDSLYPAVFVIESIDAAFGNGGAAPFWQYGPFWDVFGRTAAVGDTPVNAPLWYPPAP